MPKHAGHRLDLHLSKAQVSRLRNGHAVQVRHEHLWPSRPSVSLEVNPILHKKAVMAYHKGKGVRVQLSPHEIHGNGLKEIFGHVRNAYNRYVKPHAAPVLKGIVTRGLDRAIDAYDNLTLGGLHPEIESLRGRYAAPLVEKIGKVTGAYGRRRPTKRRAPKRNVGGESFNQNRGFGTKKRGAAIRRRRMSPAGSFRSFGRGD